MAAPRVLAGRKLVDQATGKLMASHGCSSDDAVERLRLAAFRAGVTVEALARLVLAASED
jgi:AmiR/NasT family two-component response regulator